MAFFGDLGKLFNIETSEAAQIGAQIAAGNYPGAVLEGVKAVATPIPNGTQQGQAVAISQATQTNPQETQASGESGMMFQGSTFFPSAPVQAGFGAISPIATGLTQLGSKYLPQIIGGLGLGAATAVAPMVIDAFGRPKKLRVTRKLKRQVKQAVDLVGIEAVAREMNVDVSTILYILQHKLRNDGPYVTKAAVRKTSSTLRKMKHLCDMYDELRPPAKRRAPARRTSMTTGGKRTTVVT
jgi:hypothetical protein